MKTASPVLCDLDGVVWLDHRPIPGAASAIERLRSAGHRVLFVTNNSAAPIAEHEQALAASGIQAVGDVLSSAQAAALCVEAGERVLVGGGPGISEAVRQRGAIDVDVQRCDDVDAVVVGLYRDLSYSWLAAVSSAVRDGARFIATNDDATYPTPRGMEPGGGAIVAAVATAAGQEPVVAGKPHPPMVALVAQRLGRSDTELGDVVMVGDRWSTDGLFAEALGGRFALVRSGVTKPGAPVPRRPAIDAADLAGVVDSLLA